MRSWSARIGASFLVSLSMVATGCEGEPSAVSPSTSPAPPLRLPDTVPLEGVEATPVEPIVGGGLLVTADGRRVVAADLDRDVIWIVDPEAMAVAGVIELEPGDRPNRMAEGPDGQVFVALRRGGAIVEIDVHAHTVVRRAAVCAAPRGLYFDAGAHTLWVTCLGGELVELDPDDLSEQRRRMVAPDLRDVVVADGQVFVSTFRSAEVFRIVGDNPVQSWWAEMPLGPGLPRVAWRMAAHPDGLPVLLHQQHGSERLGPTEQAPTPTYYGTPPRSTSEQLCQRGVVHSTVGRVLAATPGPLVERPMVDAHLPVDVAVSPSGTLALADPTAPVPIADSRCGVRTRIAGFGAVAVVWRGDTLWSFMPGAGRIAIAPFVRANGETLVSGTIDLGVTPLRDEGHALFHEPVGTGAIACAHCHPEATDDGHTWDFGDVGLRRTQALRGGLSQRAPFHWDGEFPSFADLMNDVFVDRMGGRQLTHLESRSVLSWLDTVPHLPASTAVDPEAVSRGAVVFEDAGCRACHATDGTVTPGVYDVGTGEPLKVPSLLGAAHRTPLMHDGCATTMADRFDSDCGGGDAHGITSTLTGDQLADLIAYLTAL